MADHTKIEWTDATWNPITGCSVVSPGCTNCYAMKLAGTRLQNHPSRAGLTKPSKAGPVWTGEVRLNRQWLHQPSQWTRSRMIFVCAHGDLFAEGVPDEWILDVLTVIASNPQHIFQVLTKRADRMLEMMSRLDLLDDIYSNWSGFSGAPREVWSWPLHNLWLGVSVEDQKRADERREPLACLSAEGWMTWVSYEPALGPVDWKHWTFLDWLVSGGESGRGARPSHPDWHRAARDFCAAAGIPFLFKQWGEYQPCPWKLERLPAETDDEYKARSEAECSRLAVSKQGFIHEMGHAPWSSERVLPQPETHQAIRKIGKKAAGRLLDGIGHNAFPITREVL